MGGRWVCWWMKNKMGELLKWGVKSGIFEKYGENGLVR